MTGPYIGSLLSPCSACAVLNLLATCPNKSKYTEQINKSACPRASLSKYSGASVTCWTTAGSVNIKPDGKRVLLELVF